MDQGFDVGVVDFRNCWLLVILYIISGWWIVRLVLVTGCCCYGLAHYLKKKITTLSIRYYLDLIFQVYLTTIRTSKSSLSSKKLPPLSSTYSSHPIYHYNTDSDTVNKRTPKQT